MRRDCILALDAGTTNVKALAVDSKGKTLSTVSRKLQVSYPNSAWVEQSPTEIWRKCQSVLQACIREIKNDFSPVALGISNQRETLVSWNRETGEELMPAIVWQCRRSAEVCARLREKGREALVFTKSGLQMDPLFPSSKMRWVLENCEEAKRLVAKEKLCLGTVDSWLIWKLTNGKRFVTDASNASRTQLLNLETVGWDDELLEVFDVPRHALADILPSNAVFGTLESTGGAEVPINAVLGDSHAALFGQKVFSPGKAKATYGTGSSLMTLTPAAYSKNKSVSRTIAWQTDKPVYALEGNILVTGSGVEWMSKLLGKKKLKSAIDEAVESKPRNETFFVPALSGMAAPYWDDKARGAVFGLSFATRPEELVRAALEAIAFQIGDVFAAMESELGSPLEGLLADGRPTQENWLMQFQTDILGRPVIRNNVAQLSALGAAYMAGYGCGVWPELRHLQALEEDRTTFRPRLNSKERTEVLGRWHRAVSCVLSFSKKP